MTARRLPHERVAALLAASTTEALAPSHIRVRSLPDWVVEYGVATSAGAAWLWVAGAAEPGTEAMDQAVLDLPPGCYVVDVLDAATGARLSRETATASPLVIGVPRRGSAVAVRIAAR
jgi:hypothetical protein